MGAEERPELTIDSEAIEQILDTGQAGLLSEMIEMFASLVPEVLKNIHKAHAANDVEEIYHRAHLLKGSCHSMGAVYMANLCVELEQNARTNNLSLVPAILDKLKIAWPSTLIKLEAIGRQRNPKL